MRVLFPAVAAAAPAAPAPHQDLKLRPLRPASAPAATARAADDDGINGRRGDSLANHTHTHTLVKAEKACLWGLIHCSGS